MVARINFLVSMPAKIFCAMAMLLSAPSNFNAVLFIVSPGLIRANTSQQRGPGLTEKSSVYKSIT
jgi:hypothetical protein